MRVCIVAEHASTRFGGEAILPVHYFRLLRTHGIESWLIVHARTQTEVAELFPEDSDRILFVPDLPVHKLVFFLSRFFPRRVSEATFGLLNQLITQLYQRRLVSQLIRERNVELIHQPIPVAPRFPSAFFGLGVPVVIGPLNGGMEYPAAFRRTESWISRAVIALARLFVNLANRLMPGKLLANVVLVANERTRRALPNGIRGRVIELVENGIDFGIWEGKHAAQNDAVTKRSVPRFVFMGRLVDWKAVDIVIRALAHIPVGELELIGDGPMLESWRSLAAELQVEHRIHFSGWLPQQECPARLQSCVALVLPSIYECGGAVVLEAMALGKPVIATNWGGPADYLDASCGVLVEPESYSALVNGFATAMQMLIDEPKVAESMGAAGRARAVRDFDWQRKIETMMGIYQELTGKSEVSLQPEPGAMSAAVADKRN